jgi:RNA recognition motif-containing protein
MGKKLFIGNLPYSATNESLADFFRAAGNVESARIITDRDTGRSKGFGFVEMSSDAEAQAAINQLNGKEMDGRPISAAEARPKPEGTGGGGYRDRR